MVSPVERIGPVASDAGARKSGLSTSLDLYFDLVDAIQSGDDEATRALISPDFVLYQDGGMPYGGVYRGPDEFMKLCGEVWALWGGSHFEPQYQLIEPGGTRICAVVYFRANIAGTDETVDTMLSEIWDFKDGQAVEARIWYHDTPRLTAALARNSDQS